MNEVPSGSVVATDNLFGHQRTFAKATEIGINYISTVRMDRTIVPFEVRKSGKNLLEEKGGLIHYVNRENRICLNYRQKGPKSAFIVGSNCVGPKANYSRFYIWPVLEAVF